MQNRNRELWLALLAIVLISLLYLGVVARLGSIPAAQSFFGHSLGVLGIILMIMTETLYSIRKRSRNARWGRMANWLQFHIFTGLVGPYMVLLHTSWKFNGLAGVVMLMTTVVVFSGFIGRYIYTAVPRTADGVEMRADEIETQIRRIETTFNHWLASQSAETRQRIEDLVGQRLFDMPLPANGVPGMVFTRVFRDLTGRLAWLREKQRMDRETRAQVGQMDALFRQKQTLQRQLASLATARRLLATWHAVHLPLGLALFTSAFVHIAAAIYYATLLH